MGALALTGQPAKRAPFEPLPRGVSHVPYGDVAALDAAVDADTAAVVLEPILGEAGVIVPPEGYLRAARRDHRRARRAAGDRRGADRHRPHRRLVRPPGRRDRARTSSRWPRGSAAACRSGPASASGRPAELLEPGQHGTTFGGNPVCCAAALAVLDTIAGEGLLEHVPAVGKEIATGIEALGHPLVTDVSGAGLMIGVGLAAPVSAAVSSGGAGGGLPRQQRGRRTGSG